MANDDVIEELEDLIRYNRLSNSMTLLVSRVLTELRASRARVVDLEKEVPEYLLVILRDAALVAGSMNALDKGHGYWDSAVYKVDSILKKRALCPPRTGRDCAE